MLPANVSTMSTASVLMLATNWVAMVSGIATIVMTTVHAISAGEPASEARTLATIGTTNVS